MSDKPIKLLRQALIEMIDDLAKGDIIRDFLEWVQKKNDEIALWQYLFYAHQTNRSKCEDLISTLCQEQLVDLSEIIITLKDIDDLNKFKSLQDSVLKLNSPTETSFEKANQLLISIEENKKDIDLKDVAAKLIQWSNHFTQLAGILYHYEKKRADSVWTYDLARKTENDLDALIHINEHFLKTPL